MTLARPSAGECREKPTLLSEINQVRSVRTAGVYLCLIHDDRSASLDSVEPSG